jgi:hypothetical protein
MWRKLFEERLPKAILQLDATYFIAPHNGQYVVSHILTKTVMKAGRTFIGCVLVTHLPSGR